MLLQLQFEGLTCCLVQEVGQQAAHDGLVTDNQHVLLPLQLHDDRLQPLHQILVGLRGRRHQKRSIRRSKKQKTTIKKEQISLQMEDGLILSESAVDMINSHADFISSFFIFIKKQHTNLFFSSTSLR